MRSLIRHLANFAHKFTSYVLSLPFMRYRFLQFYDNPIENWQNGFSLTRNLRSYRVVISENFPSSFQIKMLNKILLLLIMFFLYFQGHFDASKRGKRMQRRIFAKEDKAAP